MTLDELLEIREREQEELKKYAHRVNVSVAAGCLSLHSDQVLNVLRNEVVKQGKESTCKVTGVGCMGLCAAGPLVRCEPQHTYYRSVPYDKPEILEAIIANLDGNPVPEFGISPDIPFFA